MDWLDRLLDSIVNKLAPYKWLIVFAIAIAGIAFIYFGSPYNG